AKPAGRIPPAVEARGADQAGQPFARRLARHHDVAGDLEMLVHRFARDEQMHDLRRALEDQVDAEVAHDALDRHRGFAGAAQRVAISRQRWPAATEEMGKVSRPVLSVISASLSPRPSPQSTFSLGTRTFVKRMTPL